jgi:hypothetical protein
MPEQKGPAGIKRERRESEEKQEVSLRPTIAHKKGKILSEVVRAASSREEYEEAARLCSEKLQDTTLTKASRVHVLLSRSSLYSKLDKSALAIKDAKEAIILAPSHALGYVRAAKAFHQAGNKAKANQALDKASSLASLPASEKGSTSTTSSKSAVLSHVNDLHGKWNPPRINTLPDEVLTVAFSYLDVHDLICCMKTCKRWHGITNRTQVLWRSHISLKGTMKQIDAKWTKICNLAGGPKLRSMSLTIISSKEATWNASKLSKVFPSESLERFEYVCGKDTDKSAGRIPTDFHQSVWLSLCTCKRLQGINWSVKGGATDAIDRFVVHPVGDLDHLRLEEFYFSMSGPIRLDRSFVKVLSRAKRIRLQSPIAESRMRDILLASSETLEELHIVGALKALTRPDNGLTESVREASPPIVMKKLQAFQAQRLRDRHSAPAVYNLIAPDVTSIRFQGAGMTDNTLIASCMDKLVRLEYVGGDTINLDLFQGRPLQLPRCESLSVQFNVDDELSSVLQSFKIGRVGRITEDMVNEAFPSLKHLHVSCTGALTGGEMAKFTISRKRLGLASLEKLTLSCCPNLHPTSVAWLRGHVAHFAICQVPGAPLGWD